MRVLLIGGTGTLGNALTPKLLLSGHEVTIFSREEIKQKKMAAQYPGCKYVLGDVRDLESVTEACWDADVVFHLAAMKHVDLAETNLAECIKINLNGTLNVAKACRISEVSYAIFSSTDKAVLPINSYGYCKALSEKIWFDAGKKAGSAVYNVFRWGNVLGSRGSVLHAFVQTLKQERKVYITDLQMTRFWIHIDDAANFMLDNFKFGNDGNPYIPNMKAAALTDLARITAQYLGINDYKIIPIPVRPGEKIHEALDYHDPDFEFKSNTAPRYTDEEFMALVERTLSE
jgi:UDP-N-acetylglucosamine 4,6-dehydratase